MAENLTAGAVPTWSQLHKRGVARLREAANLSSPEETGRRREDSVCQQEPLLEAATSQNSHLNPDTASRRILAEISGYEMGELLSIWHDPAPELAAARYEQMLQRLQAGEPLQYVLGSWGFRRLDLFLDNRVLIPRPETEIVVEVALRELANRAKMLSNQSASQSRATDGIGLPPRLLVADLGCGSGAIGLSLAAECPNAEVVCTDISADALAVTRANLAGIGTAGMRVRLAQGSWYDALEKIPSPHRPTAPTQNSQAANLPKPPKKSTTNSNPAQNPQTNSLIGKLDLIVSNPPYIADHEQLPEIITAHEPASALYAGPKGTEAILALLSEAPQWLTPGGSIVCEIAPHQAEAATNAAQANGLTNIKILPDLADRPRVLRAQFPSPRPPPQNSASMSELKTLRIDDDPDGALQAAAEVLQAGGVVAIPTDTVYGLAAVASQPEAVAKLAEMKGRSASQPIAVLVADADQAESLVGQISTEAMTLMDAFWPGPLTIVLPVMDGKAAAADALLGRDKQNDADEPARTIIGASSYSLESQSRTRPTEAAAKATIGIRCPDHAWVRELASQVGPIAATSANQHGKPPSITAEEVVQAFGKADATAVENAAENARSKSPKASVAKRNLALVIDGSTSATAASTVIECLSPQPKILREGPITRQQIDAALSP